MRVSSVVLLLAAGPAAALAAASNPTKTTAGPVSPEGVLVGVWERLETSGNAGVVIEFTRDGKFAQTNVARRDGYYRMIGDRLVMEDEHPPTPDTDTSDAPTVTISGASLKWNGKRAILTLERTGAPVAGAPPIVGIWRERHEETEPSAWWRFDADGRYSYRRPEASRIDDYRMHDDVVTISGVGRPTAAYTIEAQGDALRLRKQGDAQFSEFHKIAGLWYDRDLENSALKARMKLREGQLTGVWEAQETSAGGIGQVIEFAPDGKFVQTTVMMGNGYYRTLGDRLLTDDHRRPRSDADVSEAATIRISGDSLTMTSKDGSTSVLKRLGAAEPGRPPIVGVWRMRRGLIEPPTYWRFRDDGTFSVRLPMVSQTERYRVLNDVLTIGGANRSAASMTMELRDDQLCLQGAGDARTAEFRKVADLWYDRDVENASAKMRLDPKMRLAGAEAGLARAAGEEARFDALPDAALLNAESGAPERASALATELLRLAEKNAQRGNDGDAIHKGNLALGLIALHSGNVAEAKSRLLAAGRTTGSGTLDSFGPNMVLAKELLEKGERDVVVEYFDLCRKFWKMDRGKLAEWTHAVRAGSIPEFGANLLY